MNWIESYLRRRSSQVSVYGSLSQVAEAASWVPKGSVFGPILFVIYASDLTDNLTIDYLLYTDGVKRITPENNRMPSKAPCSLVPNGHRIGS